MFGQNRSQSITDYRPEIPNKKTIHCPSFRSNFKTKASRLLKSISTLTKNRSFPLPFVIKNSPNLNQEEKKRTRRENSRWLTRLPPTVAKTS